MKKKKTFSVLVFIAMTLSACGTEQEQTSSSSASAEANIAAATHPDSQALQKIDQLFSLTPTVRDARVQAITTCMAEKGFTYSTASTADFSVRKSISPASLTLEQARARGYDIPVSEEASGGSNGLEVAGALEALNGSAESKLLKVEGISGGIKEDGCLAQAYKDVFGSAEAGIIFEGGATNLPLPYINAATLSEERNSLDKDWSTCMSQDHEITISNPEEVEQNQALKTIETATADAQCREKTNYENRLLEINNAYLTTFLEQEQNLIQKVTEAKKAAETNAPKILNRS